MSILCLHETSFATFPRKLAIFRDCQPLCAYKYIYRRRGQSQQTLYICLLNIAGVRISSLLHHTMCRKQQNTLTSLIKKMGEAKQMKSPTKELANSFKDGCVSDCQAVSKELNLGADLDGNSVGTTTGKSCIGEPTKDGDTNGVLLLNSNETPTSIGSVGDIESNTDETNCDINHLHSNRAHINIHNDSEKDLENEITALPCISNDDNIPLNYETNQCNSEHKTKDDCSSTLSTETHQYTCPVCGKIRECKSLSEFNSHIDVCLNKNIVKECSRYTPEDHKRNVKVTTPKGKKSISTGKKYVINIVYFACEICLISNF